MTGQVFTVGSIVEFYPDRTQVKVVIEQEPKDVEVDILGWASVVVSRDMWVVTINLEPFGDCPRCGMADSIITHLDKFHEEQSFWKMGGR